MMATVTLLIAVFVMAAGGTGLLRRYALARGVLDVPNDRSSHRVPTPRGGGVAIVVAFLASVVWMGAAGVIGRNIAIAIVGGGAIVALIGFFDDHAHVAARWRLCAHFGASIWVLAWIGGVPSGIGFDRIIGGEWIADVLAMFALVWLLNLYNFMDGIDGIAGGEAVTCCLGAACYPLVHPVPGAEWLLPASLGAAAGGFLLWNLPPARIFMGDAGSGFVGLMLGALALRDAALSPPWLFGWAILLGVFVVDATWTLLHRLMRRERVYEAHRSHAYQHAAIRMNSHRVVTLTVLAINVLWLLPLSLLVAAAELDGITGVVIAYVPLLFGAWFMRAGAAVPTPDGRRTA